MKLPVVVGVDGSAQSAAAAEWAGYQARRSGSGLRLLHAVRPPRPGAATGRSERLPDPVGELHVRIARLLPELDVSLVRCAGDALHVLSAAAEHSELLVLGSRGLGGFAGPLVGSVALDVVAVAHRPVVLVRSGMASEHAGSGEVVLGVEGSRPCEEVIGFAFEEAAKRGAVLRAVHGGLPPAGPYLTKAPLPQPQIRIALAAAQVQQLQDCLDRWSDKFPEVRTSVELMDHGAARALVQASASADLLVVGRRIPERSLPGLHLGPVAHAVVHHAHCPVAVVPHTA
ncbi:universal stress protein [Kitasatospora mediocidica]|uniref:universal stress protein n=1 Tax=Kitasatospora mediocidica TaxID=58352 RepID=UPI00055BF97E|nr:universal stress protein [Kitasatospora mediocidica]